MLTFEPATREDLEPIFVLNKQLIDQYEDLSAIRYDAVLQWVRRSAERYLGSFRRILWNGEHAGYYCLVKDEGRWELDSLFVFPDFQGRGIGTEVLKKCQQEASPLFLYVFQKNTGALKLYQRMGFQITKPVGTRYRMRYQRPCRFVWKWTKKQGC